MGRLLYTFDSPRQKRAATIYIYNNDNNQIEVYTYNAYTRIRTTVSCRHIRVHPNKLRKMQ